MAGQFRKPPRDLDAPIDRVPIRDPDSGDVVGHRDVTIMDRIVEAIRTGASIADAANRAGMDESTLRKLRREGINHCAAFFGGKLTRPRGSIEQKIRLAQQMALAETEAKMALLATAGRLAHGGLTKTEIVEKTDGATGILIERVHRTSTLGPDPGMVRWLLERRWANEYSARVEVTGAEGGPVAIDTGDARDELRRMLDDIREKREASLAPASGNGESSNGEANPP